MFSYFVEIDNQPPFEGALSAIDFALLDLTLQSQAIQIWKIESLHIFPSILLTF